MDHTDGIGMVWRILILNKAYIPLSGECAKRNQEKPGRISPCKAPG
jgi:hypothetical protein